MSDTKANVDSYIERLEKPAGVPPFIQREVAAIMRQQQAEIERLKEMHPETRALIERDAEIERLRHYNESVAVCEKHTPDVTNGDCLVCEIERLRAVVDAAKDDMECAKANCGQYPEAKEFSGKDCSAFTERGLRCSDCPVDVWLASTSEALAALEEADDE